MTPPPISASMTARPPVEPKIAADTSPSKPKRSLLRSVGTVTGLTLISRVLGLLRDILMAGAFGLTIYADAFYVAWTLPNLFRRLCGEGALSSAFLPVFVDVREHKGPGIAQRLARSTVTRLALVLAAIVLILELGLGITHFLSLDAFQGPNSSMNRTILTLSQILIPYLWFICLAGLVSGILHSEGDFARPAAMAIVLNIVWIAALLITQVGLWTPAGRILLLAVALVVGGSLQLLLQVQGSYRAGYPLTPLFDGVEELARVRALYLPIVFGMAIEQFNILMDRGIAWLLIPSKGGVAALYYSMRLVQLPIALTGTALATVLFPMFAKLHAEGRQDEFKDHLDQALKITLFITLPAALGLVMIAPEIISLLFEHGQFGPEESRRTALCLICYSASVLMISLSVTQIRSYHARQDSRTPVRVGIMAVLINLVLNLTLVGFMQEAGLALATSIAAGFSFCALYTLNPGRSVKALAWSFLRCSLLCAAMALACQGTLWLLSPESSRLLRVGLPISASILCYGGLAILFKYPEWIALRRLGRKK